MAYRTFDRAALVRLRKQVFPSRTAFCVAAGISRTYSQYIESGRHEPRPRTTVAIAAALGCAVDDLYVAAGGSETVGNAEQDAA